jgi:hypothetical protein
MTYFTKLRAWKHSRSNNDINTTDNGWALEAHTYNLATKSGGLRFEARQGK